MATEIQFYHLLSTPLPRALPKLMEKALGAGMRCVVRVADETQLRALDDALWSYDPGSFLPHGTMHEPQPERQPVYLTTRTENPNGAQVLVMTAGQQPEDRDAYARLLDLFDGHDETALQAARERWKAYKDEGYRLRYVRQQPGGGWQTMASANMDETGE